MMQQQLGLIGAAVAATAAGVVGGLLAERKVMGRAVGGKELAEPFGTQHSTPRIVTTDDGVELWVEVDEARSGAAYRDLTLVFSHGYALNLDGWWFQRRNLSGVARCVYWDQRGHGRSGRGEDGTHTIDRIGNDLAAVIDAVAPDGPLVLIGHSMGGMTVMSYAKQHATAFDDRVVGVGLLATSSGDMTSIGFGIPKRIARLGHRVAPGVIAAMSRSPTLAERSRRSGSDLGYILTRTYSFASPVSPSLVDFTSEMLAATPIDVVAQFVPIFSIYDAREALTAFHDCEVLVMVGANDVLTPPEHSRAIAREVPHAEFIELPSTGHMLLLERHVEVNAALRDLLERSAKLLRLRAGA
ncbi:MAG: alpha/beta hydrolase [Candidatus Nanopelagicales bacterium]